MKPIAKQIWNDVYSSNDIDVHDNTIYDVRSILYDALVNKIADDITMLLNDCLKEYLKEHN